MDDRPPPFNALHHGLFRRLVDRDEINEAGWLRARAESSLVGTCRLCGGHLQPLETLPDGSSHLKWFEARCVLCHHEVASPAGRVLRRSSRRTEQPPGWWEIREMRLRDGGD
jgi:hypothetical protein